MQIKGLSKAFPPQVLFQEFSLEVPPGSIVGLLGPNGSGKTTLLRMVAGLEALDAGTVFSNAHSPVEQRQVGYCPQTPILWKDLTAKENFRFVSDLYGISKKEQKRRFDFLFGALGLVVVSEKKTGILSGGFQKRLNLALSLVQTPNILLLDEPTANLDAESKAMVRNFLPLLAKTEMVSVLCASHDLEEIAPISVSLVHLKKQDSLLGMQ